MDDELKQAIGSTLGGYLRKSGRGLLVGDVVDLRDENGNEKRLIVGNCTPYIEPTTFDGGIGWSWDEGYGTWAITHVIPQAVKATS